MQSQKTRICRFGCETKTEVFSCPDFKYRGLYEQTHKFVDVWLSKERGPVTLLSKFLYRNVEMCAVVKGFVTMSAHRKVFSLHDPDDQHDSEISNDYSPCALAIVRVNSRPK